MPVEAADVEVEVAVEAAPKSRGGVEVSSEDESQNDRVDLASDDSNYLNATVILGAPPAATSRGRSSNKLPKTEQVSTTPSTLVCLISIHSGE